MAKLYNINKYLRKDKMPHIWCPGCGNGMVTAAFLRAVDDLKPDPDKLVIISGIGCSSRISGYLDFNTLHTIHGRALTFATGIKLGSPDLEVVVISGDGDIAAIGGNHFLHACRRNINITTICINNNIYGMTGGQVSPLTPAGTASPTAPFGSLEAPLPLSEMALAAGATYVARGATFYSLELEDLIRDSFMNKGFSLVEVITQCPVHYGRRSGIGSGTEMLKWQKENTISINKAKLLPAEAKKNKILRGVLSVGQRPEYTAEYQKMVRKLVKEAEDDRKRADGD